MEIKWFRFHVKWFIVQSRLWFLYCGGTRADNIKLVALVSKAIYSHVKMVMKNLWILFLLTVPSKVFTSISRTAFSEETFRGVQVLRCLVPTTTIVNSWDFFYYFFYWAIFSEAFHIKLLWMTLCTLYVHSMHQWNSPIFIPPCFQWHKKGSF